jgi:hypothetical protein
MGSGRLDKNTAKNICASNYYSEKEPKHVAFFWGRDIFFTTLGRSIGRSLHFYRPWFDRKG